MAELFILLLGFFLSGLMAFSKLVFGVEIYSWLACLIPLGVAVLLSLAMNGLDIFDVFIN